MRKIWQLFITFFKLGAFTFGGGYAMISLIENEIVDKKGWLTHDEMLDIITIAESTPGPLAINMATFVGTKIKGFLGAVIATLGLVIPPFVIISLISLVLNEFKSITLVAYALKGIQAGVVVLIFNACIKFLKGMDKTPIAFIFLIAAFLIALLTDFSVVLIILIGGVVGVAITFISSAIAKKKLAKSTVKKEVDKDANVVSDETLDKANNEEIESPIEGESIDNSNSENTPTYNEVNENIDSVSDETKGGAQ